MNKLIFSFFICFCCVYSKAQLTIYSNLNLQGSSATCVVRTIYTDNTIPNGLNNNIESISLSQGFMATLAENADGTGERFTYMANTSNLNVNLAFVLQNKVSFIRVLKLPNIAIKKKGSGNTNNIYTQDLNVTWFYDWGFQDFSTPTREFAPMAWGRNHGSVANVNIVKQKDSINHYLSFNEPDHDGQANMWVAEAVPLYKNQLAAGLRMGSPSCTESQYRVWLDSFTKETTKQNMDIDFVGIHWYDWGNWLSTLNANPNPTDVFNRFKAHIDQVWDFYKKPIWITEFNANVNRLPAVHQGFMNLALPWLDANPNVERYAYFFGNDIPMYSTVPVGTTPGILSTAGSIYSNHASVNAYPDNIFDTRPSTLIALAAWDPSSFTQGGLSVTNFTPTTINTNLTAPLALTRGSGVELPFTTSANGHWGGTDWTTGDAASGVSANKFLRFSLRSRNGKSVNYHSIDKFNIRINSTGPIKYQIDYQLNSGAFYPIATVTGPPRATGNYVLGPIDLSAIAGLQNVAPTSTITFRITPFDASAANSSFLIGSGTTDTDPDLVITGGYSDANLITLPISLSNFQLKRNNKKVQLNWETKSEVNFSHFELQRKSGNEEFKTIGIIKGSNQLNGSRYLFSDELLNATTYFYQLKMVDNNGSFKYSNVLKTSLDKSGNFEIYPSVSNGNFITASFNDVTQKAQVKIVNTWGQLLKTYTLKAGSTFQTIETSNLQKGLYIVVFENNGSILHKKFIKQ